MNQVAWPRPHTGRSQIYLPWSFLHNSLVLVPIPESDVPPCHHWGMRPENHPRYQPNVLRAIHLQLKTKSESKQTTQHWA
jgi:hypothetical protein